MDAPNHLHFLIPGLGLIFESSFAKDLYLPALQTLLSRAAKRPLQEPTAEAWLCTTFGLNSTHDCPLAPFSLIAENGQPGEAYWLKADPVHLRVHGDQLVLLDSGILDISKTESAAIIATLNHHFKADGLRFHVQEVDNWYVSTEKQTIVTHSITEVLGRNVNQYLPKGKDGTKWNSISNEIQMLLFSHPVNEERENKQKLTINSVWFWGGGTLCVEVSSPYFTIVTNNLFAKGLGLAANVPVQPLPTGGATGLVSVKSDQPHLITIESLEKAAQYGDISGWRDAMAALEEQWCKPLLQALRQNKIARITIYAFGANRNYEFTTQRKDLWQFWKRRI